MTLPSPARPSDRGRDVLVEFPQDELIAKWEEFFEEMGYLSKVISIADRYPEERTIAVAFDELNRFDTDMAIYLLRHPLNVLTAGEEAIRRLVPPGEEAAQIHLRVKLLPRDRRVPIRDLRAKHLGQYIAVEGLVRKSTEVRPRVTDALFQCLRCGTIIKEPQDGQNFREPLECYEEQGGCKRSASATKFRLMTETSMYVDTQKLEIQESPEGLRGGQEPQRLTLYLEDDLTGRITPGERVVMNGVLRSVQKGRPGAKSTLFDIFMDVNSVEKEQVEFEEIEVTEEDARLIREAGASPDIFRMITASIAPSLYGMHVEKEALALQLFSGVPKVMPDGRRIRGDIHVLMVGDPGVGKSELLSYMSRLSPRGIYATGKAATAAGLCVAGESLITTDQGVQSIQDIVQPYFPDEGRRRPLETSEAMGDVATFDNRNRFTLRRLETVWRIKSPPALLRLTTQSGLSLSLTPATKVLVDHAMGQSWMSVRFVRPGMRIATARRLDFPEATPPLVLDFLEKVRTRILVEVDPPFMHDLLETLRSRFGTLRGAAARLLLPEDLLYDRWREGRHAVDLSQLLAVAKSAGIPRERVASAIRNFSQLGGHKLRLPIRLNADLAYFAGLIAGDGSVERGTLGGYSIRFSNSNPTLLNGYRELVELLFAAKWDFTPQTPLRAATVRFHSALVATMLERLGVPPSPKSHRLSLPDVLLNAPRPILAAYLRGLLDTDGNVYVRPHGSACLSLTTTSADLAKRVQLAFLRFGIRSHLRTRRVAGRRAMRIDGKIIESRHDQLVLEIRDWESWSRFRDEIGLIHPEKASKLASHPARAAHSNLDLISGAGPHLREIRRLLGLSPREAYGEHEGGGRASERGAIAATHEALDDRLQSLDHAFRADLWEGCRVRIPPRLRERVREALRTAGLSPRVLAAKLEISHDRATEYFYRLSRQRGGIPVRVLQRLAERGQLHDEPLADELSAEIRPILGRIFKIPGRLEFLKIMASGDVRWEPVGEVSIQPTEERPTVYDLTVRDAHAFVANGILVHNTAAAVRDEFGEGRWTLEAGALVLADLGLACLHPESEVVVDGVPVPVASLFDSHESIDAVASGRSVELSVLRASVAAFNLQNALIGSEPVAFVARRRYKGPIARVTLSSGFELRLTPEHVVLDGETLEWKKLEDLRVDGRLVAAQRLPPRVVPIRILDILPDHWIVQPTREQKEELKAKLLERFPTLGAAYRAYGIAKDALSGRSAIRVDKFRALLRDLKLYQTWAMRPLAYGRKGATERLRVAVISPSLAYVLGFIHGDGHVVIDDRHSTLSIFQSRVHLKYISRILTASKKVSARRWGMHARETEATIRGGIATSSGYHMHRGSNLLAYLYDWLTANDLANLLRLDDEALRGFLAGLMDSDGCVSLKKSAKASHEYQSLDISLMFSSSRRANLRVMLALRRFDIFARLRQGNGVLYVQVTSRTDAARLVRCLSPYSAKTKDIPPALRSIPANHEEVPRSVVRSILQHVRPRPWSSLDKRYWSTLYDLAHGKRRSFKPSLRGLANAIRPWLGETGYAEIQRLLGSDYALERISEIRVEPHDGFVYDLRVPSVSNFVCDGVIVHNCIDEIEKMNPQDRSAIHEAMEQQRISVAKAGITAVLQSRCAILAAANPKFGRFDEHKYISEQIDLPPALLSRFDIIFSMIDRPQADRDRELAEHVLKGHRVGEIARRRETGAATEETQLLEEPYTPYFSPDFLRKYVAYAKRIYPVMTEEAMGIIEKKYLEIRKTGEGAGSSVPITPRQLEAIIRLAEAGARLRLSEAVTADDAERAVRIVEYWMGKVAGEEGRFDIDIIQTGISQSQREQIISIRDIINGLAGPEGVADYEDIVRLAQDRGIPPAKVDAWLKRWAQEGEIYSPAKNKYKLVERL